MKKLIGIATFVTIGLFGYTHDAPARQADNGTRSSPMADNELVAQASMDFGCPIAHPICCEPEEDGGCYACAGGGVQCP